MLSEIRAACCILWVTMTTVYWLFSSAARSSILEVEMGSRALVDSSISSTSGSTASSAADGPQRYSTVFYDVFDTVTQVIAYCDSEEEFNRQMDALHTDLLEYHRLYDIYNDYDGVVNVKTINDNAGTAPVQVDDKILGMLELARQMYDTTGGKLNIAMGSVLRIWHDCREAA